jgi:hypothetical protein
MAFELTFKYTTSFQRGTDILDGNFLHFYILLLFTPLLKSGNAVKNNKRDITV